MIVTELTFSTDLDRGPVMMPLATALLTGDEEAHRFVVSCYRGNAREKVDLSSAAVTGYFVRTDGATLPINGDVENGSAVVQLPAACYAVPGRFSLVVKAAKGDTIASILWVQGAVGRSHTDNVVDPGESLPTLDELMAQIGRLEQATTAAEAVANLTAEAQTLPAGSAATASYANGKLKLGIPKGKDSETALPTGYRPYQALVVGPDGKPRWEERTHYDYSGTVLPLSDLKVLGGHHTFDQPLNIMPVVGVTYRVSYQGTEYTVTAKPYVDEGKDCVILGNQRDLGSGENTKEPFIMLFYPPETVTNKYYGFLSCDATSASTVALGIESGGVLKKLDPKFLPEGTGNGGGGSLPTGGEPYKQLVTDGDGNAVWEDRLAYEDAGGMVEILPETACSAAGGDGLIFDPLQGVIVPGQEYTVIYNGVAYKATAKEFSEEGMTATVLGNMMMLDGQDSGEPFFVMVVPPVLSAATGGATLIVYSTVEEVFAETLAILGSGTAIHTIPQKYLPSYLYGSDTEPVVCLEQDTYAFNGAGSAAYIVKPITPAVTVGDIYTVEWNGTEYQCTGITTNDGILLGAKTESEREETPFQIICAYAPLSDGTNIIYGIVRTYEDLESVTVSITRTEKITKIPRKYLDIQDAFVVRIEDYNEMQCTYDEILQAFDYGRPIFCLWKKNLAESYSFAALSSYSGNTDQFVFYVKDGTDNIKITIGETSGCTVEKNIEVPYALYLTSPDGTRYKVTVSNDGTLSAAKG